MSWHKQQVRTVVVMPSGTNFGSKAVGFTPEGAAPGWSRRRAERRARKPGLHPRIRGEQQATKTECAEVGP